MIHLVIILLYLFTLIGIGMYKAGKIKTQSDFAVAGRSLTPWVLVGTMLATWMGTGSILGNAGKTYDTGMAALILPLGSILGIVLLTKIAGKVRAFEKFTVPEILGDRFGPGARMLSVIALVIAYMVIVSYQFNAGGAVLNTVLMDETGNSLISIQTGTIIAAIFIIAYTMLAGLVSVAYTDVANGIIIIFSFVIAIPIFLAQAGGFSGMAASFEAMGKPEHMNFFGVYSTMDIFNFCLPPFLLIMGDANMYQRFFASKNAKGAEQATKVLIFAVLLAELMIIFSAWVVSSMIPDAEVGKYVLIYAAHKLLPTFLGAIMMTTIVGIIISTADSFLLVPATTLMRDVYLNYINPKANEKKIVLLSRVLVLGLGIIAYIVSLGFAKSSGFFERALYAYTIYGAAITPSLVAALFWKRATKEGAVVSILTGTVTTLLWKEAAFIQNIIPQNIYNNMDEVLPAITLSVVSLVVVSLLTKKN
ncbi:MAG: sodium:solute symporter family protein [Candidatus Marinimicrobia bacterium]|jgi:SSS family transporter|nr:sodium:solute symporter family protein [Candidatus Neomarinimicrobiota bacterium]MBT3947159.1 sodium:solute symporter family protein [Candidatus Neomarinimicrobiota bacterium]MBT4063711.1 sodium:solute symporter family protein [Candidatus Neomarinimicrobiota bacterium]MBT4307429.1 sodium:solute symporter family protein [Candidatus Neomarinimicrobiota bacterium]MBT4453263.1 sodium:solute symporter family protein [Candidatus Neomarinimicrobiota bacterium]|tara:strand:+ start:105 stop:1535 length:1431 start_codon:yes stop_codon:yes gene_type:complete